MRRIQTILFIILSALANAQQTNLPPGKQQLLLQLSLNYYTVVKEGEVDQDSSLLLACHKNKLSRWTVLTDGFGGQLSQADNTWIDTMQPQAAIDKLNSLQDIEHVKLLVLLGAYYAFQPGHHQTDRDSGQLFLLKAKEESESLNAKFWLDQSLCLLGKNYFKAGKVTQGTDCFNSVINACRKSGNKALEAKAWDYQGTYIPPSPATIMLIIKSITKANEIYQQIGEPEKQVNTLMNMAYINFLLNDLTAAKANALDALKLENSMNFPFVHYTYAILSLISQSESNEGDVLMYVSKAIEASLATKDSLGLAYFYLTAGYDKSGQKRTALPYSSYWIKKSFEVFNKDRDPDIYIALYGLVSNLCEEGKSAEAILYLQPTLRNIPPVIDRTKKWAYLTQAIYYQGIKDYHLAEKYFLLTDQLQDHDHLVTRNLRSFGLKYRIGRLYFLMKNYPRAETYLQYSLTLSGPKEDGASLLSEVHMMLFKIDSSQGNYESATKHLQQYVSYNDSVVKSTDAKSIAGMRLQLLMTEKEKDVQVLQAKNALQDQQASTTKKLIYIGLAIAIFIIGMLYNRYDANRRQRLAMDRKNAEMLVVIREKNELLQSKEWLLKEVHHRVKNNLHTIICLLESQAAYLENDALEALESSQHRIYAMSLIHQKLYQSDNITTVNMGAYLPEFTRYLRDSFDTGNQILFKLDVAPIKLGVSYAVPLSLIINEAVTNAIKYAFPGGESGVISISLKESQAGITLAISDNGIGIDAGKLSPSSNSLGLKLLRGLSEDIKASCSVENSNGTVITIAFRIEELSYLAVG